MKGRRKTGRLGWIGFQALATLGVTALLYSTGPLRTLEYWTVDWRFQLRGSRRPTQKIVIVEINEATYSHDDLEKKEGRIVFRKPFILWGDIHARVLNILREAGTYAIGFDFLQLKSIGDHLVLPADPDLPLAEAIAATPQLVMIYSLRRQPDGTIRPVAPIPRFDMARQLGGGTLGFDNTLVDDDQVVRNCRLAEGTAANPFFSFPLMVAAVSRGVQPRMDGNTLMMGRQDLPTEPEWRLPINFLGAVRTFPHLSYQELLADPEPYHAALQGAIALICTTAKDDQDYHVVPFSRGLFSGETAGKLMSGIELHANVVETLLSGNFLKGLTDKEALAGAALLIAFTAPIFAAVRYGIASLLFLVLGVVGLFAGWWFFRTDLWVLPLATPGLAVTLNFAGFTVTRLRREKRKRREVQQLFGRYVSGPVLHHLLRHPEALARLGGERRLVTVLFSDIRGFTNRSEAAAPEEVTRVLNRYLTRMVDVVFAHGGTVDKYVGDAIMAIFNWPVEQPDHADRATAAAVEMRTVLEELRREWAGTPWADLAIGVGVNTGPAILGNIGHPGKMEITAIGDTVNVASRLEGLNKEWHTTVIVGAETHRALRDPGRFAFGAPQAAALKGHAKPVEALPVLEQGEKEGEAMGGIFRAWRTMALLATTLGLGAAEPGKAIGMFTEARGPVKVLSCDLATWQPASFLKTFLAGEHVVTGEGGRATLVFFEDGRRWQAGPGTRVLLTEKRCEVESGPALTELSPLELQKTKMLKNSMLAEGRSAGVVVRQSGYFRPRSLTTGAIRQRRPVFHWWVDTKAILQDNDVITLTLKDPWDHEIWSSKVTGNSLVYPDSALPLQFSENEKEEAYNYIWEVSATRRGRTLDGYRGCGAFRLLPPAKVAEVEEQLEMIRKMKKDDPDASLDRLVMLAACYTSHDLWDDVLRVYPALLWKCPRDAALKERWRDLLVQHGRVRKRRHGKNTD